MLMERLKLPGIVGLILVSVLLGPYGLGLLQRNDLVQYLGQAGLLFIVFVAGLEIDLARFSKYRSHSLVFGSISYMLPQSVGFAMAFWILDFSIPSAILLGSMLGSHTLLAYPIASRLGIARTTPITTSVGGTIITDVAALMVLAVVANYAGDSVGFSFWIRFALFLAIFIALVFKALPLCARWFYRTVPDEGARDFLFTILMVFAFAWLAEFAGLQPIIGAFFCGIALNRLIPERSPLMSRIQFVGKTLLLPMFLISVGMLVDPRALVASKEAMIVVAAMSVSVVATKLAAAFLAGKLLRYDATACWLLFGMSVNQAAATLAAVVVGFNIGLFDASVVNGAIVMILVSSLVGPWCTERWGRKLAQASSLAPHNFGDAPQRILIPIANPSTIDPLMDLALLLREPNSREPIFPLAIVTDGSDLEVKIAQAEKLLALAAVRGNAGESPIYPVTRVDVNIAEGIRRTLAEQQITTVLIGWNGQISLASKIFGSVVDQLLAQSRQLVVVAKLTRSLNHVSRVILAVPRSAEKEPTFPESIHVIKSLCQQLSATLRIVGPTADTPRLQAICQRVKPEVAMDFLPIEKLRELPASLRDELHEDDLVVLLGARDHRLSWTPALETLPRNISHAFPQQPFLVIYPAEEISSIVSEPADDAADKAAKQLVTPARIAHHTPLVGLKPILEGLLAGDFAPGSHAHQRLCAALLQSAGDYPVEVGEGVYIIHTHDDAVYEPRLYLATAAQGIEMPKSPGRIDLLLALVSPSSATPERHLRILRGIALHLRKPDVLEQIRTAPTPDALWQSVRPLNEK